MTLKEQTKQKIEDTKELILQMIPTRTSELINDTDYNCGYLDSNLILHLLNVNTTLSSSQTIVSNGSTMTISALVTDFDGNTVSNAPVQFYINGTASGNPINTNSNGIATYTYSGTGIGKVKIYAKVGTFQSETYEVIDGNFYDTCITGSSSTWVQNGTDGSNTLTDNGRVIEGDSTGVAMFFAQKVGQTGMYCWNDPLTIEFDAIAVTGEVRLQIYSSSTLVGWNYDFIQTGHYKVVYDGTNITRYLDGVQQGSPVARTLTNSRIGFIAESGESVTFKNFVIYPI